MYEKNLSEDFRLRLSSADMDFLRALSNQRNQTVSEVVRSIIGEYKRSLDTLNVLSQALAISKDAQAAQSFANFLEKGEKMSNGDTKTDIDN